MLDGIKFVKILDEYFKNNNISRKQFCKLMNIPYSTFTSWKTKNILPPLATIDRIAKFMHVSLSWLVYDEKENCTNNTPDNPYSRISIFHRIETATMGCFNDFSYDEPVIKKYLNDVVEYEQLLNWSQGKINLDENVLPKIAEKLRVSLQWLLTQEGYYQEDFDAFLYGLAKTYPSILKGYDCMEPEDRKSIDNFITTKLKNNILEKENHRLKVENEKLKAELNKQKM